MGFSLHSVPSLSNTAMRSSAGTNSALAGSVTAFTNATIAVREGPSVQDGNPAWLSRPDDAHPASRKRTHSQIQASRRAYWCSNEACMIFPLECAQRARALPDQRQLPALPASCLAHNQRLAMLPCAACAISHCCGVMTVRNPMWDMGLSGSVPRRALAR